MGEPTVGEVMTRYVRTAVPDTPFKELVTVMVSADIAALPIIDATGHPIGMVTESDMLSKLEYHDGADTPPVLAGSRSKTRWRKSFALTAANLMTAPAITTSSDVRLSAAARHLATENAHALCVIDSSNRLIGILTRRDALSVFLRGDDTIHTDIERELPHLVHHPSSVTVHVDNGIVTLAGEVPQIGRAHV